MPEGECCMVALEPHGVLPVSIIAFAEGSPLRKKLTAPTWKEAEGLATWTVRRFRV